MEDYVEEPQLQYQKLSNGEKVSETLSILSNSYRREIISLLREEEELRLEEISDHLSGKHEGSQKSLEMVLHHTHLPRLEGYGVLTYSSEAPEFGEGHVEYHSEEYVEEVLDALEEKGLE